MILPKQRVFWSVSLGHMTNDIFMSMGPVVLAFINGLYLDISAAELGLAISARQMMGAISQPLFGWISDKRGARWLGAGGVAVTVSLLMVSLVLAIAGNYWGMLTAYALSALGSGAFHPVGTAYASHKSEENASTHTAYFFLFGQFGLALGPALAGYLLGRTQIDGAGGNVYPLFWLALIAIPSVLLMGMTIPRQYAPPKDKTEPLSPTAQPPLAVRPLLLLALLVVLRGIAYPGSVAFIPVLFRNKGWEPAAYGGITSVFWLASAFAGVFVGSLADRFDRRKVIVVSLILAAPTYVLMPLLDGAAAFGVVLLAGMLVGGPHSILVVMAQSLLPGKKGFASGVALGFIFGVGALGTLLIGYIADGLTLGSFTLAGIGLERTFQLAGAFVFASAFVGLTLPRSASAQVVHTSTETATPSAQPVGGD